MGIVTGGSTLQNLLQVTNRVPMSVRTGEAAGQAEEAVKLRRYDAHAYARGTCRRRAGQEDWGVKGGSMVSSSSWKSSSQMAAASALSASACNQRR